MASTHDLEKLQKEGRLELTVQAIQKKQIKSHQRAAKLYNVSKRTLKRCIEGVAPQAQSNSKKHKLYPTEEQALVKQILALNRRGFPPYIINVQRIANLLLTARGQIPTPQLIGKNQASQFINAQLELQTKWNHKFYSQRARYKDPRIIGAQFKLIDKTQQAYRILNADSYNFNKTGFIMGVAATLKVITSSNTIRRAIAIQLGNRKQVTAIKGINVTRFSIPPFLILAGKLHQAAWYRCLPPNQVIALSDNGWTTNQLGLTWIQHFNRHTKARTQGVYRLLILNSHGSHATPEFD